jgi:NhaA family Na+:H+ antiporter
MPSLDPNRAPVRPTWGASQHLTERVVQTLERFLHIEAVSGGVLITAATVALVWANSPFAHWYDDLWHLPLTIGIGSLSMTQSLHFVVNEGLMTIFFLVAGLEIRRELHEGALSSIRSAALPLVAAIGGVIAPAAIYLSLNWDTNRGGWAVPIATDIAFAVGVLALLGKSIPSGIRILLLALAIIDDIVAVLVIAIGYSHDLNPSGAGIAAAAILIVFVFQRLGIRSALAYTLPGVLLWLGLWRLGVHPTLAGVALGLITPALPLAGRKTAEVLPKKLERIAQRAHSEGADHQEVVSSIGEVRLAQRDLVPPVVTVQSQLHGWVAYGIMPLFALANAGVSLNGLDMGDVGNASVVMGILLGLLLGKPLGILFASWLTIRFGWCELPTDVGWRGLLLIAFLGGIGFTMSIFIAALAFSDEALLATAKLAVLIASGIAAAIALVLGKAMFRAQLAARQA